MRTRYAFAPLGSFPDDECVRTCDITVLCRPYVSVAQREVTLFGYSQCRQISMPRSGGACRHHPQPTQTPKYRNLGCLWRGCISPICSTSRTVSPLSVFMRARYREHGPRNINSRTCGIAGRRTLISEIASGRYYRYRRYTQIGVQCSGVAAPVLTVSRVTGCILVCSRR